MSRCDLLEMDLNETIAKRGPLGRVEDLVRETETFKKEIREIDNTCIEMQADFEYNRKVSHESNDDKSKLKEQIKFQLDKRNKVAEECRKIQFDQ